ncbi:MAG: AAA family ATPase [Pseudomonadota bacterium]
MAMYDEFFDLKRPPFRITPDTSLFYSGAKRGAVLDGLVYAVLNGEGIVKVVGEVGSGKTMLCRMLEVRLPRHVEIVYIANPSLSPENILQVIAFELKVVVDANVSKLEAMQKLQGLLMRRHAEGKQIVVFIEEAQSMPLATLEEVRLLSNLETQESKLMQVVLFGQPELDDNLSDNSIRQLRERITHSFNLEPLMTDEVCEYLNFRMWVSGYRGQDMFVESIAKLVADYSQGMIRRINILADKVLLAAYADNTRTISRKHVLVAAHDSQFVPRKPERSRWPLLVGLSCAVGILAGGITFLALHWSTVTGASLSNVGAPAENAQVAPAAPVSEVAVPADQSSEPLVEQTSTKIETTNAEDSNLETTAVGPDLANEQLEAAEPETVVAKTSHADEDTSVAQTVPGSEQNADTTPQPQQEEIDEVDPAPAAQVAEKPVYDSAIAARMQSTREYFWNETDNGFSIQLLTVDRGSADKLSEYIEKLPSDIDLDKVYVYETEVDGSIKLAVLYNQYASLDSAWEAVQALPEQLQRWQPFVRTVRSLKTEIAG